MTALMISRAIMLATAAHIGQLDKQGRPYILHPLRVMLAGCNEVEQIAGVLHDTVEDTPVTLEKIEWEFGAEMRAIIDALSRREGETYDEFIDRCASHPVARIVKIYDLTDNLRGPPTERHKRYRRAIRALSADVT